MALYRTYRPATFADVVGQEHVTDPLSHALDSGRINHAYLFSGPRGCGKTSSARILARSLNCVEGPTSTPCGVCSSCVALAPGGPGNLDVIELDAASHGGVDDTRELRDRAFYAPSESRYRVFIVDEAHMVTNAGFNALLKIVEEPPEHLIFVFATTEPEKVLPTIRSRTHHYPFRLLAPPVMRALLEKICASEQVTVAADVYPLVIRAGGGSPRDSLSILDQLLAGAGDRGVTYDRALALLGVTDVALIDEAIDALAAADGSALFGAVEKVVDAGHDPRRFAIDLLERLRDLILLQAVPDAADRGLVEAPGDQLQRMQSQIESLGPAALTRFAETVHAALGEMRGTTSPRLLLEVMCARMLLPAASTEDAALLQRLERLESGVVVAGSSPVNSSAAPGAAPEPESPPKFVRPSQRKAQESAPAAPATPAAPAAPPEPSRPEPVAATTPEPAAPATPESAPAATASPRATSAAHDPEPAVSEAVSQPKSESKSEPEPEPEPTPTPSPAPVERAPMTPTRPEPVGRVDAYGTDDDIPLPDEPSDEFGVPDPEPRAAAPEAEPAPPTVDIGVDADELRKRFQEVRAAVRERSKSLEPMLSAAVIHDLQDRTVVLSHPVEVLVGRLSAAHATDIIRAALTEVFGTDLDVRTVHQPPGAAAPAATGRSAATEQPAPRRQTFSRPSRAGAPGGERQDQPASAASDLPPEPEEPEPPRADEELTDAERDEMVADAHSGPPERRLDPDQVALELLKSELGARPLE
ncbi:DNA polymerase III subunit gamma and tau [Gordonia insulae]|uniref:DNA polymerase III subunit gamma/tau n=1 Tax=Gordonia insulae TaxID=2420509 RepID=A0A3G8JS20_9ACTN|nr:DNA polymerase III subunit gamma and tau [Gordonia insulae]AZG47339.1 DNA polymerase III subunit gamma/tau [Gordonia insulae]